jgi:8-oxo-dGTP pyrophosphatase MutT (NUDIX family)
MAISTPRPAATVVVAREGPGGGFELLMVRRNDRVAFMGGAYVFPGGRVDEHDVAAAGGDEARAFRLAGARELLEEASVTIEADNLVWFAHWITPEVETRRYDTRFFLAPMPAGQQARHDNDETTELAWLTPAEAIERCLRGDIMLPPPTWTTLKGMQRHRTTKELFAWARGVDAIPVVQPQLVKDPDRTMLTLPGDPTYPTIAGWEVPDDTRFVLKDGRWLPVRA